MHRSVCCAGDGGRQSDVGTPEWPSVEQSSSAATRGNSVKNWLVQLVSIWIDLKSILLSK